jgi:hypothetical protein
MNTVTAIGLNHVKNIVLNNNSPIENTAMENTEEVISRLKFLGLIQKDEKIDVRHISKHPDTYWTKIYRMFLYPDNRSNTLKFIRDVISRSFDIIECSVHQKNTLVAKGVIGDLGRVKNGLVNLKYTYSTDTKFCCDMDVVQGAIVAKLSDLKKNYPNLFEDEKN